MPWGVKRQNAQGQSRKKSGHSKTVGSWSQNGTMTRSQCLSREVRRRPRLNDASLRPKAATTSVCRCSSTLPCIHKLQNPQKLFPCVLRLQGLQKHPGNWILLLGRETILRSPGCAQGILPVACQTFCMFCIFFAYPLLF